MPKNLLDESIHASPIPSVSSYTWGLFCGLTAAVLYTFANSALRYAATSDPGNLAWAIWVTAHKALPACLLTWLLVLRNYFRGQPYLPSKEIFPSLIGCGLLMQFGGNLGFQMSLGYIGLAMTVPITFSMILLFGAITSRIYLTEPITRQTLAAMGTLIIAVSILSLGAGEASFSILQESKVSDVLIGIVSASISGAAYGVAGVIIRRNVTRLPVSGTLVFISSTGFLMMTPLGLLGLPWSTIQGTPLTTTLIMLMAGVFNALAFYMIGMAFRFLTVNQTNLVNAAQIALAALFGVAVFAEPVTIWLMTGSLLTMIGLFMMDRS